MPRSTGLVFARRLALSIALVAGSHGVQGALGNEIEVPRSVAHRSNYTRTANEAEIAEILEALQSINPNKFNIGSIGQSHNNLPIQSVQIDPQVNAPNGDPNSDLQSDKPVTIVVIGGIHSGECAGKEAMLELLREMASDNHPAWHQSLRIVFVPSLNPDGNSQRALDNRPGQIGPVEGMGTRENGLGMDLNRDFIKLESPEIRSLVKLCDTLDADVLIDLHTTNGSQHRYELTYDPPHHPATPAAIREFMRGEFLPAITRRVSDNEGLSFFYYGNFDRGHTRWSTYGYEGRYGTNYMGLRGRIGILSEAYSYASYETRVRASQAFVSAIFDSMAAEPTKIHDIIQQNPFATSLAVENEATPDAQPELEAKLTVPLTATLEAFPQRVIVKGFEADSKATDAGAEPKDYLVDYFGDFRPAISTTLPLGYFVPPSDRAVIDLLKRHGISSQEITLAEPWRGEQFLITEQEVAERPFQGHNLVRLEGDWQPVALPEGTLGYWVEARGPLVPLMATILEPESADSAATWNFISPDRLEAGSTYPILRIVQ